MKNTSAAPSPAISSRSRGWCARRRARRAAARAHPAGVRRGPGRAARRHEQERDDDERAGVERERGRAPQRGDEAAERRADRAGGREADVEDRVALAQRARRCQHVRDRPAATAAGGQRERAVDERERQDGTSEKAVASSASPAKARPPRRRAPAAPSARARSIRAVSSGARNAGTNGSHEQRGHAERGVGLSSTRMASAITPKLSPSSLSAYETRAARTPGLHGAQPSHGAQTYSSRLRTPAICRYSGCPASQTHVPAEVAVARCSVVGVSLGCRRLGSLGLWVLLLVVALVSDAWRSGAPPTAALGLVRRDRARDGAARPGPAAVLGVATTIPDGVPRPEPHDSSPTSRRRRSRSSAASSPLDGGHAGQSIYFGLGVFACSRHERPQLPARPRPALVRRTVVPRRRAHALRPAAAVRGARGGARGADRPDLRRRRAAARSPRSSSSCSSSSS